MSAYGDGGTLLNNISVGDFIFCHIAGVGFVGIGTSTSRETPAASFSVNDDGIIKISWTVIGRTKQHELQLILPMNILLASNGFILFLLMKVIGRKA